MDIYEKIKYLREKLGLSQEELAKKLGYKSKTSIHKIEQKITDLPLSKVKDFANVLKVSPEYLMGYKDEFTTKENAHKSERDLMIEKYQLNSEELAEYDRIVKLSIEMNTLMFKSHNIELGVDDKEEMDYELSETLKKAFISSLIAKRESEKKE